MTLPRPALDPTYYPETDDMGENTLETFCRLLLIPLLRRFLESKGTPMFVSGNQFIYWRQFDTKSVVAPDLYVLPHLSPDARPGSIKTWELGGQDAVLFALELVSTDKSKDYVQAPMLYRDLGVQELVIYDPSFQSRRGGHRFQVWRKQPHRGLVLAKRTDEDRVESEALGCFLVKIEEAGLLRLATGEHGEHLVLTEAEAERAEKLNERSAKEAALLQLEAERIAKKMERMAKEAAARKLEAERIAKLAAEKIAEEARLAQEKERAAKEKERAAKEKERAAKEKERAAKEKERAAKKAAEARIRELEALLAKQNGKPR